MVTHRISFEDLDLSRVNVVPDTQARGYTVVAGKKGTTEAMYFPRGSREKILAMIGIPTANNDEIQDALDFNDQFGLYISAPPGAGAYYGSAYLTSYGLLKGWKETDKIEMNMLASVLTSEANKLQTGVTITRSFATNSVILSGLTAPLTAKIKRVSLVRPDGRELEAILGTGGLLQTIGGSPITVGSYTDTVITVTGAPSIDGWDLANGDGTAVNTQLNDLVINFVTDVTNEAYMAWVQKSQTDIQTTLNISLTEDELIEFYSVEEVLPGKTQIDRKVTGSLIPGAVDGFNANIYLADIFPDNGFTFVEINVFKPWTTLPIITPNTQLVINGKRGDVFSTIGKLAALTEGWTEALKPKYDEVKVFFDGTCDPAIKSQLNSVIAAQEVSIAITGKKLTQADFNDLTVVTPGVSNRQIAVYVGEFLRKDTYTGRKYWSNLIGFVATKLIAIMQDRFGGVAPMYSDTNGLGGSLSVSVDKVKWEFNKEQLRTLDRKNINPIVLDTFGLMIVGQKTTQTSLTDWSYLGHTMSFVEFKREMRDSVLVQQIGKPNDAFYQELRRGQSLAVLNKRLTGAQPVWSSGQIIVEEVNTDDVKNAREFHIEALIKVTTFSEGVKLRTYNVDQSTVLS